MIWLILGTSGGILALAFFLRRRAQERLAALDLAGEVIYWDDGAADEVLVSREHGLTGKPDYIRRQGEELIPVEQKSRVVSVAGPYDGELLQLAAYCLLVEERFGVRVRRGQLLYQNRSLEVPFDDGLRRKLLDAIAEPQMEQGRGLSMDSWPGVWAAPSGAVSAEIKHPHYCRFCLWESRPIIAREHTNTLAPGRGASGDRARTSGRSA
jgi:CRISPR-associated exonuclease Cas4